MNHAPYCHKFTKEEINELPLFSYNGAVELVRTEKNLQLACKRISDEHLLGFDTESKPTFRKGPINKPSLIQIACSDVVFLIQLSWLPLNSTMIGIFENSSCIKAGVATGDDMRQLQQFTIFQPTSYVDLGAVARRKGLATHGLRSLAANFMGVRISKSAQCSNWEQKELTPQQIRYAATDAWVSRQVYLKMDSLGFFSTLPMKDSPASAHSRGA